MISPSQVCFLSRLTGIIILVSPAALSQPMILDTGPLDTAVEQFREEDRWYFNVATDEAVSQINQGNYGGQWIKNAGAFDYLRSRIPLLDVPDPEFQKTYYYRWWTFRKHIKNIGTAASPSFVITEYIDPVPWADSTNAISAAAGHHLYEGRWLNDPKVTEDYTRYWMSDSTANPRRYSAWIADGMLARNLVIPDDELVTEMVASPFNRLNLDSNWGGWVANDARPGGATQQARFDAADGLFWQNDDRDAMEVSYGGSGKRPSINSYLYGDAVAIAEMFRIAARKQPNQAASHLQSAARYDGLAADLRAAFQSRLWDTRDDFFKTGYGTGGGNQPSSSADTGVPRHTWWSTAHLGTNEWLQYEFDAPVTLDHAEVYFFDDSPSGGTRVPASWALQAWNGASWVPCVPKTGQSYGVSPDVYNAIAFEPVNTSKIRLTATLRPGVSAGTLEWRMFSPQGTNLAPTATPTASYTDIYGGTVSAVNDEGRYPLQDRKEQTGFTPWYFGLPDPHSPIDFPRAWSHLGSFSSNYGLTSGALNESGYQPGQIGSCCQWNGPVWPFATTITLTAMARLLHAYQQDQVTRGDYFGQLKSYAYCQRFNLTRAGKERTLCWIDESMASGGSSGGQWTHIGGNGTQPGSAPRGMAYNHSGFADLVITGLLGLKPRADDVVEIAPLLPTDGSGGFVWDHFCLDQLAYHGHMLTIVYDKTGGHYAVGQGFAAFADGIRISRSETAGNLLGKLPNEIETWGARYFQGYPDLEKVEASADPDHDGSPNLVEYLFGSDPSSSTSKPASRVWIASVDGQGTSPLHLFIEATVRETAAQVSIQPQLSSNLTTWTSGDQVIEEQPRHSNGDGTQVLRFCSKLPVAANSATFMRFQVTYQKGT